MASVGGHGFNNEEMTAIIQSICNQVHTEPNQSNVRDIMFFIKKKNIKLIREQYPVRDDLVKYITSQYIQKLHPVDSDELELDNSYERVKNIIIDKKYTEFVAMRKYDRSNWFTTNIFIDSRYRDTSSTDYSLFKFNIVPKSNSRGVPEGSIISNSNLTNITQIELNSFIIPYKSDMNHVRNITLTFVALASNSITTNNTYFHFTFNYDICSFNDNLVILRPMKQFYTFNPPVTNWEDISIRFNDPIEPINFGKDRMVPASITYTNPMIITFSEDHTLNTSDIVIIEGLTTLDDTSNTQILNVINNPRGIKVTKINNTDISIDVDGTTINSPGSALPTIYFQSKRIAFPLKIHYITNSAEERR